VLTAIAGLALASYGVYEITHAKSISDRYSRASDWELRLFPLGGSAAQPPVVCVWRRCVLLAAASLLMDGHV
jgi:hypothetical protein